MANIAIIPARGGSKGIKHKNLQTVGGISLVGRTVLSAKKSACFDEIYISSDSDDILAEGKLYGAVPIKRPVYLSQDNTRTIDVIIHLLEILNIKTGEVTLLQPTSPLRTELDVKNAVTLFKTGVFKSVFSACECQHHPYKAFTLSENEIQPISSVSDFEAPRQQLPKIYRPNGAIYINDIEALLEVKGLFAPPQGFYLMSQENSIDIDCIRDLELANLILGV